MADSIRKRILAEVVRRLSLITTANGFQTDAGQVLDVGIARRLGPNDPDAAIAVLLLDEVTVYQAGRVASDWPIEIIAVANASDNREAPWLLVEDVLADIRRAMELPDIEDRTFARLLRSPGMEIGSARTFDRDEASEIVGVSQTYGFPLVRGFGVPDQVM
jgi:hypothetical protein